MCNAEFLIFLIIGSWALKRSRISFMAFGMAEYSQSSSKNFLKESVVRDIVD